MAVPHDGVRRRPESYENNFSVSSVCSVGSIFIAKMMKFALLKS
jgi:hypothetical protein